MTQQECTVYKCGFCRKKYLVKWACEKHEKYCPKNPNNMHACFSCPNLERHRTNDENSYGNGPMYTVFTCKANDDKQMHSYVAERIGHISVGDTERMPLQCPDHPEAIEKAAFVYAKIHGLQTPVFSDFGF